MTFLECSKDDVLLFVHVQPSAKNTQWSGLYGERVKIRLAAPPVNGRANQVLCVWLANELAFATRDVVVLKGEHSRQKTIVFGGAVARFDELLAQITRLI